jgi:hypothetical protein
MAICFKWDDVAKYRLFIQAKWEKKFKNKAFIGIYPTERLPNLEMNCCGRTGKITKQSRQSG